MEHGLWTEGDAAIAGSVGGPIDGREFRWLRGERASVGLLAVETSVAAMTLQDQQTIDSVLLQIARIVERVAETAPRHASGETPAKSRAQP